MPRALEGLSSKLKEEINVGNPSLEDIKKIGRMLSNYGRAKTINLKTQYLTVHGE